MALVTRAANARPDASSMLYSFQLPDLIAGEDIDILAPCYIASADGLVYMSNATAADEEAEVIGIAPRAAKAGQAITLFGSGFRARYGSGFTPGNIFYIAATNGRLDDGATVGDAFGVAVCVSATDVVFLLPPKLTAAAVGDGTITEAKILDHSLTGHVVNTVANANTVGGIPVLFRINCADAAGDTDITLADKIRVLDAWAVKTGGAGMAGNTVKLTNVGGGGDITDAMALTGADQTVSRAGTINDAQHEVVAGAGGVLRATVAKAGANAACTVYVLAVHVA